MLHLRYHDDGCDGDDNADVLFTLRTALFRLTLEDNECARPLGDGKDHFDLSVLARPMIQRERKRVAR